MLKLLHGINGLWNRISNIGVAGKPYSEARRLVLTNQVAFLGALVPQLYNIYYFYLDHRVLWPVIIINNAGSFICMLVLWLNSRQFHKLAKLTIAISPNIQIFLLTYYLSTATGMHLLHIMMVSFVLFILSNEKKSLIWIVSAIPVILYIIAYWNFTLEASPIILDADVLTAFYIIISLTVFFLVMLFFSLFYREILKTEHLLNMEYERSENLLLNILPKKVADRLKTGPGTIAEMHPSVTILFADIVGFTGIASSIEPARLISTLNECFSKFDRLVGNYNLEKIKTIGDAYMVAGGIPTPMENHIELMANLALDMLDAVASSEFEKMKLDVRIGFHTGPVIAGVIGTKKFSYDIWGDAVNLASRLESHGVKGKIHVSREVYNLLRDKFLFECRGEIPVKGIGTLETYFLTGRLN